jgi:phospholipid/cholesterol/gamma-HCH transport system substrate-binding protein
VQRNGKERPGSFPTTTESLKGSAPHFAFFRPYAVDFTGWLDDFSHSGIYDANGSASRVATSVNAFAAVGSQLQLVPETLRDELGNAVTRRGQTNRCPGSMERPARDGTNPYKPSPTTNCDPTQVPPGK